MYKALKPTTFDLPLDLLEDLDIVAKELNKKKRAIIAEALEMYIDYQDVKLAEKRLKDSKGRLGIDNFFKELGV